MEPNIKPMQLATFQSESHMEGMMCFPSSSWPKTSLSRVSSDAFYHCAGFYLLELRHRSHRPYDDKVISVEKNC
jgi:hypothetical protein